MNILLIGCKDKLAQFPSFNILLPDSTTIFNTKDIEEGKPIILMIYSADCDYCNEEIELILTNINLLENTRIILTTYQNFNHVNILYDKYKLSNYRNIVIGQDFETFLPQHFQTLQIPLLAIYNSKKHLKQVFLGVPDIDNLINLIQ